MQMLVLVEMKRMLVLLDAIDEEDALLDELVDVAAGRLDGADRRLAELALAVLHLLLAARLRLARPRRRHPRHQHVLVAGREVHEPDRPRCSSAWCRRCCPTSYLVSPSSSSSSDVTAEGPRRRR